MSSCEVDPQGHCITCSDEALVACVVRVDSENGLALITVEGSDAEEEIDITLVDDIAPGSMILVHGGVAIANIE